MNKSRWLVMLSDLMEEDDHIVARFRKRPDAEEQCSRLNRRILAVYGERVPLYYVVHETQAGN
jgi:hypothetical protein